MSKNRLGSRSQQGFSLIELIIATALLGLIASSLIPLLGISYKSILHSGQSSVDIYEAGAALEAQITDPNSSGTPLGDFTLLFSSGDYQEQAITIYNVEQYRQDPLVYLEAGPPNAEPE